MKRIAVMQLKSPDSDPVSLIGKYTIATQHRKRLLKYLPFHNNCWDFPTWCEGILKRMIRPRFRLVDATEASGVAGEYDVIFGSVMATNLNQWQHIMLDNPAVHFILGGYVSPMEFQNKSNVTFYASIESSYQALAVLQGTNDIMQDLIVSPDYYIPSFDGSYNGFRLQMSQGCLHNCGFCDIPFKTELKIRPDVDIIKSIIPLMGKHVGTIYVDDKTFGQSPNYKMLGVVNDILNPEGIVVQTTALKIQQIGEKGVYEWQNLGVTVVEIGVESYNNEVLKLSNKPGRRSMIDAALQILAYEGMTVSPNFIIGLRGETTLTYDRTAEFMRNLLDKRWSLHVGWFNVYCLADYHTGKSLEDMDETSPFKSWQTAYEHDVASYGYGLIYQTAIDVYGRM